MIPPPGCQGGAGRPDATAGGTSRHVWLAARGGLNQVVG